MKLIRLNILSNYLGLHKLHTFPVLHKLTYFSKVNNLLCVNIFDNYDLFLMGSVMLETISTICITKTNKNKLWFLPVYLGYFISFYLFPKCLNKYSISVAYTLWCGFGIISTNFADFILFGKSFTCKKVLSIFIILFGIFLNK